MSTDAALTLLAIIAGRDTEGLYEVRCLQPGGGVKAREWFPVSEREACLSFMAGKSRHLDVFIGAALRVRREGGKSAVRRGWCLWADVDDPKALQRLEAFYPTPTLIVRSGSGRNVHAYWSLDEPLPPAWLERANRRLAHHLGADMKAVDAARILRPPGTVNWKEAPTRVTVASVGLPTTLAALVENLPDPPTKPPAKQPRQDIATDDLLAVPAGQYYAKLTGREVTLGNVTCPFHKGGRERDPSMRLYETTFYCFGCCFGGSVYEFAGRLWGYSPPVRGDDFRRLRDKLQRELGAT